MDFDFDTIIESLHDQKSQKQIAENILDAQYTADIVPSDFNFTKDHIGYFMTLLKTGSVQVERAAMILLTLVVHIPCGFQSSRIDMIVSGGLLQFIIDQAVPLFHVQKEKSLDLGILFLKFIHAVIKGSESVTRKIINSEGPLFNSLVVILESTSSNLTFVEYSCRIIKAISEYQSLRAFLRKTDTDTILLEFLKTEFGKIESNCFYVIKALTNMMVHSDESKLDLLKNGIVEPLIVLLPLYPSLVVQFFAHLLPQNELELDDRVNEQILQMVNLIKTMLKESKEQSLVDEYLYAISKYSKYSKVLQHLDLFDWLVNLPTQSEQSLCVLANMTFHDKSELFKKHYKNLVSTLWKSLNDDSLAGNALAVLVNLAFHDKESQKICVDVGPDLFPHLFKLSEHTNEIIAKTSLECIRNLCIDDQACTTILQVGLERMFETIKERKPDLRIETMQIVRNIFLISPDCFDKVFRQVCFIPEIVSSLSQSADLQKCALDIIEFLVDKKQDNLKILLLDCGIQSALLEMIAKNSPYTKTACKLFINLKKFRLKFLDCDIWKTVLRQWDDDDKKYGRKKAKAAVKPKRKIKKKK
ncbi:hypothetical protein HDV04_002225 [Boothiomyces sp. JEL0838]|nr:hypothetical protein HDV04_002225 [Boothiomyces sp. JEL0838]